MKRVVALRLKRIFDVTASLALLIVFSPLLLLTAIAVLLCFGRPIFFFSPRVGYKAKVFQTVKFRSMRNIFDSDGQLLPDEARITRFSKLLRATSFDELPQLWNVLKGEMSLIGPRPVLAEFMPYFRKEEMRRFCMLPGITGWAQVNGRNSIQWDERLAYDVEYVDTWSLSLDIKIIFMTIPVWLRAQGINTPGFATFERLDECRQQPQRAGSREAVVDPVLTDG